MKLTMLDTMDDVLLAYGNPSDGFTFIGPVTPNDGELERFIERYLSHQDWWFVPIITLQEAQKLKEM